MISRTMRHVVLTTVALLVAGGLAVLVVIYSGIYDIAASRPHSSLVGFLLTTLQKRSVAARAEHIEAPALDDPALVREGLILYRDNCLPCHGAPGEARDVLGIGMNPSPPPLVAASREWSDAEIYWIITNGLKMAGMPAFDFGTDPRQAWALTAFVQRMQTLSTPEYGRMVAAVAALGDTTGIAWLPEEEGWERLHAAGNAERGATLIRAYGCASCHVIPGIGGHHGQVGPPLTSFGRRHYIAGLLANTPESLVAWLIDPPAVEPGTAMPDLGVTPEHALDIAAYLYTIR